MANFRTHLGFAAICSSIAAAWLQGRGLVSVGEGLGLAAAGTLGGLLPDLDAENSVPTRWLWQGASWVAGAFAFSLSSSWGLPHHRWVLAACAFATMRFFVSGFVMRMTRHRGLFHSIPSALICGASLLLVLHYGLAWTPQSSLRLAGFLSGGFILHLLLDELYSVDVANARIKRSFGSALKLYEPGLIWGNLGIYAALAGLFYLCAGVGWPASQALRWLGVGSL